MKYLFILIVICNAFFCKSQILKINDTCEINFPSILGSNPYIEGCSDFFGINFNCNVDSANIMVYDSVGILIGRMKLSSTYGLFDIKNTIIKYRNFKSVNLNVYIIVDYWINNVKNSKKGAVRLFWGTPIRSK